MRRAWALLRWLVLTEVRMYVGLLRLLTGRHDVPAGTTPVRYVSAVSLALWAFTAVSVVELVALHLILPWPSVRLVADVLGIWGVVWVLGLTGCHYVYPHLVTPTALRLRSARPRDTATIAWTTVAGVAVRERGREHGKDVLVEGDVLHVAVGRRTNLDVRLDDALEVVVHGEAHLVREVRLFADVPREAADLIRRARTGGATQH